jgi:hypothetical protein
MAFDGDSPGEDIEESAPFLSDELSRLAENFGRTLQVFWRRNLLISRMRASNRLSGSYPEMDVYTYRRLHAHDME